jgi:hypothetical protein
MVGWLLVSPLPWRTRLRLTIAAGLPFAMMQAANLGVFLAQRQSRPDQFARFEPLDALLLLGQFNAANLFGGVPLYLEGPGRMLAGAALAGLLALAALAVASAWRSLGPTRWLWLGGFVAPSAGLLLLSVASGTTPIELRYLAFAAPFAAALAAGAAAGWARALPRAAPAALGLLLLVQAAGAAGMALHPATRQAYRDALAALAPALGPGALLLVPRGNDGVGIVGAVLAEAPADQAILLLDGGAALPRHAEPYPRLVLLGITDRDGAVQVAAARDALDRAGWTVAGTPWRDARRGFAASILVRRPARPAIVSRMAHRAEAVLVGGADDGGEEP